jgi:hypothetical protein
MAADGQDGRRRIVVSDGAVQMGALTVPPGVYTCECTAMVAVGCGRVLQRWTLTEMDDVCFVTAEALDERPGCGLARTLPADDSSI